MLIARLLILSMACTTFAATAQVLYLGMDAAGNVTLLKEPPPNYEATPVLPRPQAPRSSPVPVHNQSAIQAPSSTSRKMQAPAARSELLLYAADWCPHCRLARQYFRERGIAYREINIETPEGKHAFTKAGGGRGIPLLVDGDRKASGFNTAYYDSFLKRRGMN